MDFKCAACGQSFPSPLDRRQHHLSEHTIIATVNSGQSEQENQTGQCVEVAGPRLLELFELRVDHRCHVVRGTPYEHGPPIGFIPEGYPVPITSREGHWASMQDCEGYIITLPDGTFAVSEWVLPRRIPHSPLPLSAPAPTASPVAIGAVFVISLARATARRQHVNNVLVPQLQQAIPSAVVEVLDAVDGQQLSVQQRHCVAEVQQQRHLVASSSSLPPGSTPAAACDSTEKWWIMESRPLNGGQMGCALSHLEALRTVVQREVAWAVILEDDVSVDAALSERLNGVLLDLQKVPAADIVYLGHGHAAAATSHNDNGLSSITRASFAYCTHALLVSLSGAQKIVRNFTPVVWPVDHHFVFGVSEGVLEGYLCTPQIIFTNELSDDSIINNEP